jgi:L-iditol 2-dehydrogenase
VNACEHDAACVACEFYGLRRGVCPGRAVDGAVDASGMRRKELTLFNVRRSNHETEEALSLLEAQPNWFAPLVTHTRTLDRIDEAFELTSNYRDGVGKMVIQP